jgi:ribosomal protein S18 acetylase RimI-like enzyme
VGTSVTEPYVRRVEPAGWADLRQARLAALADSPAAFAATLAGETGLSEAQWRQRAEEMPWFIAWSGGGPVGLVSGRRLGEASRAAAPGPGPAWALLSMWVSPKFRGAAVGDLLVSALVDHVRASGAVRLTLWAASDNDRARRFYLRLGFRSTGKRQIYRRHDGSGLPEEEMALELGTGAAQGGSGVTGRG